MAEREFLRLEGRNGAIWRRHIVDGLTQEAVADEFGLSQTRVSQIVAQVRDTIEEDDRRAMVQDSLEHLRALQVEAMRVLSAAGAPVTVGKDGELLYDPEIMGPDGKPVLVRDASSKLHALKAALAINESVRRLAGLDAVKGLDVNVSGLEDETARRLAAEAAARVAGVDDSAGRPELEG